MEKKAIVKSNWKTQIFSQGYFPSQELTGKYPVKPVYFTSLAMLQTSKRQSLTTYTISNTPTISNGFLLDTVRFQHLTKHDTLSLNRCDVISHSTKFSMYVINFWKTVFSNFTMKNYDKMADFESQLLTTADTQRFFESIFRFKFTDNVRIISINDFSKDFTTSHTHCFTETTVKNTFAHFTHYNRISLK